MMAFAAGVSSQQDLNEIIMDMFPFLRDVDVSQAVGFLLMTPYSVNITELIIKPTGERA